MNHIIGLMAMIFGFISFAIDHIDAAHLCFGFAFLLWCAVAIDAYVDYRKKKKATEQINNAFEYTIPQEIKEKFTKEFIADFLNELVIIFDDKPINYIDETFAFTGTVGWDMAFMIACKKHGSSEVIEYYHDLEWYESDMFDDELISLMLDYGLIEKQE